MKSDLGKLNFLGVWVVDPQPSFLELIERLVKLILSMDTERAFDFSI